MESVETVKTMKSDIVELMNESNSCIVFNFKDELNELSQEELYYAMEVYIIGRNNISNLVADVFLDKEFEIINIMRS